MRPTYHLSDSPTLDHVIDRSPLTVASDTPVVDAIALLSQEQADYVLVVEESQLVGVFIEQDVVRLTASGMDLSKLKLFEAIARQVITLTQSDSQDIFTAFSLMRQHRIRHLPIVDKHSHLVGLVTQTSLLQVVDPTAMYGVIEALQQQVAAQTTELKEVASSQQIETLCQGQAELEIRVAARNSELVKVNQELQTTLEELQATEEEVRSANEELATASKTAELERRRYQDLFESAPDGYLLTDTSGIIQEANSVAAALLSVHQEYLMGKPLIVFIAKQDRKTFRIRLTNLQVVEDWELYIQPWRNKPLSASIRVAPAHDLRGKLVGLRWLIRDISDRKQVEDKLRSSEEQLRLALDFSHIGSWDWHLSTDKVTWNENFDRLLGLVPGEVEVSYQAWRDRIHPEDSERVEQALNHALATHTYYETEYRIIKPDGSVHYLVARGQGLYNKSGEAVRMVGVVFDISDRKQAEEVLRQYERTVSATPDGVALVDRNYIYRLVNQTYLLRLNRCHDKIIGHPISELLGEDVFIDTIKPLLDQSLAGETIRYEAWFNYPTAERRFMSVTYAPYIEIDGTISGVVVNTRDLSELKQAEEKISEQAALLDIATDAIFVRNLDNKILFWNKGAEHLYGWSSEEALGKNAKALLNKEITPQLEEALKTVAESGSWQGELHKVDKFGKEIIVASRLTLVRDEQGQPKSILTVDTDITEKKKLEAQFLRAQRMESIGTLAGGIAHDLNNVLAPILMSAQLLQMKASDEWSQRLLKTVESSSKRGAVLIKQVLSFARGIEGARTIVPVRHLILEIDHIVKETFPKSIEFYTDIAPDLWTVSADATQLHQVLMNLVVNARDAMPNGGTLTISATNVLIDESYARMNIEAKVGPHIVITVVDTGMGIPAKVIESIFDPFFTTKEFGKGTGLGLSTALGIIKSHGGFVKVYSEVGQGAQFKVYLPTSEETATQPGEDPEVLTGQGGLVLVVDDEAAIRETTLTTLENYNYEVLTANDGIEAVVLYAQHKDEISVVLLDMMMPEMDGLTAIRTLRIMNTSIKIIATSGLASSDKVNLAVGTGAKAFLSKPYTAPELLRTLHEVLSAK